MDKDKLCQSVQMFLEGLGVDLEHHHFHNTPERVANAWIDELCSGLGEKQFSLTTFPVVLTMNQAWWCFSTFLLGQSVPIICFHFLERQRSPTSRTKYFAGFQNFQE